jgi:hypothetical protein
MDNEPRPTAFGRLASSSRALLMFVCSVTFLAILLTIQAQVVNFLLQVDGAQVRKLITVIWVDITLLMTITVTVTTAYLVWVLRRVVFCMYGLYPGFLVLFGPAIYLRSEGCFAFSQEFGNMITLYERLGGSV